MPTELLEPEVETVPKITEDLQKAFDKLFQDGVLVNLHISVWGMSHKLNEDDLGIDGQPEIIKLGKKMLIDPKVLNRFKRIEVAARSYLKSKSFHFDVANAHFVNKKQFPEVIKQLEVYNETFQKEVEHFLENYDQYKKDILEKYPEFKAKVTPYYPPEKEIASKFGFRYTTLRLAVPAELSNYGIEEHLLSEEVKRELLPKLEAQAKQQLSMTTRFVEDSIVSLRAQAVDTFTPIYDRMIAGEKLTKGILKNLPTYVDEIRQANFFNDPYLEGALSQIDSFLASDPKVNSKWDDRDVESDLESKLLMTLTIAKDTSTILKVKEDYLSAK